MKKPTPYEDVNEIAAVFTADLQDILGGRLVAFYLTGSLTYGGFDRGSSDLDFWAIISQPFSDLHRQRIRDMHASVEERYPEWAGRIEVPYVTKDVLGSVMPPKTRRPMFNAGEMWEPDPYFNDNWLINLYALREHGKALYGPAPQRLIPPINAEDVQEAIRRDMRSRWEPKLTSSEPFGDGKHWTTSHLQAYSILTMCRVLYVYDNGGVVSKRSASEWAKKKYPEWKDLIAAAEEWQMGQTMDVWNPALGFISFTLKTVES